MITKDKPSSENKTVTSLKQVADAIVEDPIPKKQLREVIVGGTDSCKNEVKDEVKKGTEDFGTWGTEQTSAKKADVTPDKPKEGRSTPQLTKNPPVKPKELDQIPGSSPSDI